MSHRRTRRERGFALIETIIAITILAVGLLGVAALLARLSGTTVDSRYTSSEVMLASEKLEDLNRWPTGTLAAGGSLTANTAPFFDQVQISANGNNTNGPSNTALVVSDGINPGGTAAPSADMLLFTRRWVIEANVPVGPTPNTPVGTTGTLRITVIVIPQTGTRAQQAQTFQASIVRPI